VRAGRLAPTGPFSCSLYRSRTSAPGRDGTDSRSPAG
jgi:hypothetical protein